MVISQIVRFPSFPPDTILLPSSFNETRATSLVASKSRIFVQDKASYTPIFVPPVSRGDNNDDDNNNDNDSNDNIDNNDTYSRDYPGPVQALAESADISG
jgi:hypothetical protein